MPSFQSGPFCYSSEVAAASASASAEIGSIVQAGAVSYVVDVVGVTASSITYKLQDVNSSAFIVKESAYTPVPCGLLDTADGLIIGWGIAAVWLFTAGVLFLRRGLHE